MATGMRKLSQRLEEIRDRPGTPEDGAYLDCVLRAREVLTAEPESLRPMDTRGRPGGMVLLETGIPIIVIPDLHARMDFLRTVLEEPDETGASALERLDAGELGIVCLGDGFHAESRAAERWQAALEEYLGGYERHAHMDEEMRESMGLMEMVMELKSAYPSSFHFLKGNHENIANEDRDGNYSFVKFAQEGPMVLAYMQRFYGEELLEQYYRFEKDLPLLAVGRNFLLSHAEPASLYPAEAVIGYRDNPDVVYGLTWTDNGEAVDGSVELMLRHYLPEEGAVADESYYFGGHRPVRGAYALRARGRYVQIHDPGRRVVACLPAEGAIDLNRDIREAGGP